MIYITGDTHAEFRRFNTMNFPEQKEMTKDDYVIICGDFGGVWFDKNHPYFKEQKSWLDWLELKPFTTLFVDGNHENFDLLYAMPVENWHGGKVHKVNTSVFHLMRGEMFNIDGLKFFTFGGASSHDIDDGIIDDKDWKKEAKRFKKLGKTMFRVNHVSWWEQELPSDDELTHATETLEKYNYECDFFVSHCCATSTLTLMGYHGIDKLTQYFERIKPYIKYKKHFFGHYHDNRNLPDDEILIYEQIIRIA